MGSAPTHSVRVPSEAAGIAQVAAFVVLGTANAVYSGNLLQDLHPFTFLFWSFLATSAVFLGLLARRQGLAAWRVGRESIRPLVVLNVTSALNWIGYFYALRFIEPAVVSSIMGGVGPLVTIGLERLVRHRRLSQGAATAAIGILAGAAVLAWGSLSGRSGLADSSATAAAVGLTSAVFGGLSMALTTIAVKQLGERGWSSSAILAHRFYLLVLIALCLALGGAELMPDGREQWTGIAVATAFGVILPIWLLQRGIIASQPFRVAALLATAPALTYLFQAFDARIEWSAASGIGCLLVSLFTLKAMAVRHGTG